MSRSEQRQIDLVNKLMTRSSKLRNYVHDFKTHDKSINDRYILNRAVHIDQELVIIDNLIAQLLNELCAN